MNISSRPIRTLVTIACVAAAGAGWSTLLWPPVRYFYSSAGKGFWSTLGELLSPANSIYPDGPLVGWIFLTSTAALAIAVPIALLRVLGALMRYVDISEADLSLLELSITLRFSDDLTRTTIVRDQLFHANQPGTTAYHYRQTAESAKGRILANTFEMESAVNGIKLTKEFSITSSDKLFDAIEIFNRPLPTSLLATYLPDWVVRPLHSHTPLLEGAIVRRSGQIILENEHSGSEGMYQLNASRRAKNVSIKLDFPADRAPKSADVRCFVISGNVVSEMHATLCSYADRRTYTAEIGRLEKSSLRIQWINKVVGDPEMTESCSPFSHKSFKEKLFGFFKKDEGAKTVIVKSPG